MGHHSRSQRQDQRLLVAFQEIVIAPAFQFILLIRETRTQRLEGKTAHSLKKYAACRIGLKIAGIIG